KSGQNDQSKLIAPISTSSAENPRDHLMTTAIQLSATFDTVCLILQRCKSRINISSKSRDFCESLLSFEGFPQNRWPLA
ncbi:hypothetical protein, partial [Agrobacterium vitis]|uniref:hypothetical protein n=1 Tax=Agrobacterium vitis TaxID=373 RepID=UPI001AEDD618